MAEKESWLKMSPGNKLTRSFLQNSEQSDINSKVAIPIV